LQHFESFNGDDPLDRKAAAKWKDIYSELLIVKDIYDVYRVKLSLAISIRNILPKIRKDCML
jgi:hypothetical protein